MVLSSSQQLVVAFTAVLLVFVVIPRMFGGGIGSREPKGLDPRFNRKAGPGPGPARPHQFSMNTADSKAPTVENMQQMRKMMEKELKSEKYKSNSKGYVFTLMPLYAIGVGVFAAYKFIKIKTKDDSKAVKEKTAKGAKKSVETENQLNELEQRLAQTEKMLNSILTQLDPLTNCVKSVASEQKNEIMSQLQSIRHLMKKRGMDCPLMNPGESCGKNLEDLIESLSAEETQPEVPTSERSESSWDEKLVENYDSEHPAEGEAECEEDWEKSDCTVSWEGSHDNSAGDMGAVDRDTELISGTVLRRRNKPE
ncbi:coiled-coil domain-containing protein 107 [Arapaima gigas]